MTKQMIIDSNGIEWYICNKCGARYTLYDAEVFNRGNSYFCSKKCILEDEEE